MHSSVETHPIQLRLQLHRSLLKEPERHCNNQSSDTGVNADNTNTNPPPPVINYAIVKIYPHDTASYTEGLEWKNNSLYESGGNYGSSKIFRYTLDGKTIKSIPVSKEFFGEGITILNNKIYQLTWREHKVFVYDAAISSSSR